MYQLLLDKSAEKGLKKLPTPLQERIEAKLDFFVKQPNPLIFAKPLHNFPPSTHRFRVGDYRISFSVEGGSIFIHDIGHRREIYK